MSRDWELYDLLGVRPGACLEDIKAAWRRLARVLHPDRNPAARAGARFRAVSAAWSVLSDPDRRLVYDHLGPGALRPELVPELARGLRAQGASRSARPRPRRRRAPSSGGCFRLRSPSLGRGRPSALEGLVSSERGGSLWKRTRFSSLY